MIPYADIQAYAQRFWPKVLKAEIEGDTELFPKTINKKRFPKDMSTGERFAILEEVRNHAKQLTGPTETTKVKGYGYTYHLAEKGVAARNREARLLTFDTREDYLKFVDREAEFAAFQRRSQALKNRYSEIGAWLAKHPQKIVDLEPIWDSIQSVLDFFIENPRPNLYLRELRLPVDTKFIERNRVLLDTLLELVLPDGAIDSDETIFEKKYGLQWVEPLIRICFLDGALRQQCGEVDDDFGLPVRTLANRTQWPIQKVLVIENLTTLVSLRDHGLANVLGLHGHGYRVANFRDLHWLHDCQVYYWGDIDVQGFEILSLFRRYFPHAKSILMDCATIESTPQDSIGQGKPSRWRKEPELTTREYAAYRWAKDQDWRQIEQEQLPSDYVLEILRDKLL